MDLLIDIGNTRCKAAVYDHGNLSLVADLTDLKAQQLDIKNVYVASVGAKDKLLAIRQQLAWLTASWLEVQSEAAAFGVYNSYQEPAKLGVDRWLAMIAAKQQFPNQAVLVIDAGTAVTIDWLDQHGHHQGGWILPGLVLQQSAVVSNTAKVINSHMPQAELLPATNTVSALQSGCLAAVIGAIDIAMQRHPVQQIVLTGGDSVLLAQHLTSLPIVIQPLLVLQGLSYYCAE